eukprot:1285242-Pyramimonas_sp.AAC.1
MSYVIQLIIRDICSTTCVSGGSADIGPTKILPGQLTRSRCLGTVGGHGLCESDALYARCRVNEVCCGMAGQGEYGE